MRSKGLSTLAALRILGNTERGLSAIHLRRLYSACVRSVLAWGAPVWYTGLKQKTLVARLQGVQNTACRWILGVYRGASPDSTNFLCSLPPFQFYFEFLKTNHALRLWHTPHSVGRSRLVSTRRPFSSSLPERVHSVQQEQAYTHPPWSDPLSFAEGRISFCLPPNKVTAEARQQAVKDSQSACSHHSIQIFTDGSRLSCGTGSAMVALQGTIRLSSRRLASPRIATATDAEIYSLATAPDWASRVLRDNIQAVSTLHFFSDSLTALRLVRDWPASSGSHHLTIWRVGILRLLAIHPNLHIIYHWSPGHLGIPGNEWADSEA